MKLSYLIIILFAYSCNSDSIPDKSDSSVGFHKILVKEVIHTSNYTYLRAIQEGMEHWFALPLTDVKEGETYYYGMSMEMENFESKSLNRIFNKIYFIENISIQPLENDHRQTEEHKEDNKTLIGNKTGAGAVAEKMEVTVEPEKQGITIAELFSNKEKYEGKIIAIKGEVVKFSPAIMDKNWIHIQDGTEYDGKFDLTITSEGIISIGDVGVFEGKITLNKDFGYGYFFEILMEDATVK